MAKILIVAATKNEAGFLLGKSKKSKITNLWALSISVKHNIDLLITGPGITGTVYHLTSLLTQNKYDLAINIGICGSFDPNVKPVRLVNVVSDCFGDFGAEDGKGFVDAFETGLLKSNEKPFKNGKLKSHPGKTLKCLKALKQIDGITVQKVHGSISTINSAYKRYGNVVESMEGAAFFFVCLNEKINCIQVRAVSNIVEKRNKKNWKINEAIDALEGFTGLMLMELENSL